MKSFPPLKSSAKPFNGSLMRPLALRGLCLHLLTWALVPAVIIGFIKGHIGSVLINAAAFGLYLLALMVLRKGLAVENADRLSRLQSPNQWPLKLLAALLVSLTTGFLAIFGAGQPLAVAVLYAAGAMLGMYLSYGFDRAGALKLADGQGYTGEEIRQTLSAALATINTIRQSSQYINNRELNQRLAGICEIAEGVIAELETDPRGIRRARKFLHVYLDSVQQVVQGYAQTHTQVDRPELEQNFRQALDAIESAFKEQQQKLLEEDLFDLDVKIEVLTKQLKHEGIL